MGLNLKQRAHNIEKMKSQEFDLAIVGGGITGAGIARDALSRGMKVALVEARDFAIGTSSRSSKLIHGGVRYLENFEFSLVFEALSERALLFKIAPHLVHPLRFLVPVYKDSRVGLNKMNLGMWLYDMLALFESPQMHERLRLNDVKDRVPSIDGRGLVGAVEYSDAYTDDDRLVIETLRDAHRKGGVIANYAQVVGAQQNNSSIQSLTVKDFLSGQEFELKAKQFVAGVGPWTDMFGNLVSSDWQTCLRPTKGVHLVFPRKKIPLDRAVVMGVEERIIFVIPRHEMVIVGTTDTDYSGDPAQVYTHVDDVNYIIHALNRYFPKLGIEVKDIVSTYSGVRPLVKDDSTTEGKTSREHKVFSKSPNLSFVAGGKYTTYRKISEEVVDFVLNKMEFEDKMHFGPSQTKEAINPKMTPALYERAQASVDDWAHEFSVDPLLVKHLVFRHGDEAPEILEKIVNDFSLYGPKESLWMGEADFAIQNSLCLNLVDFYWRRSPLFLASRDHGLSYINGIAKVFSQHFNWDEQEIKKQKESLMATMQRELDWKGSTGEFL